MNLDHVTALGLLESLPIAVFLTDPGGTIRWTNRAYQSLAMAAPEAISRPQDLPRTPGVSIERQLPSTVAGTPRWVRCRRLQDIGDTAAYLLEDISVEIALRTELAEIQAVVQFGSTRDALTGLPNRRGMIEALESQVTRSRRYHNPLSVLRLDLQADVADQAGAREALRIAVARQLKDQLRWADVCGHWNESSFLFILPETDVSAAAQLAHKLVALLGHLELGASGRPVSVPACGAVTSWTKGDDLQRMMARLNHLMPSAAALSPPIAVG